MWERGGGARRRIGLGRAARSLGQAGSGFALDVSLSCDLECNALLYRIQTCSSPHLLMPVAAVHAALISSATPSTPSLFLTEVKSVGPWSRILSASRFMTSSDAPTYWAMSICERGEEREGGRGVSSLRRGELLEHEQGAPC